jgi:hypothetical protein
MISSKLLTQVRRLNTLLTLSVSLFTLFLLPLCQDDAVDADGDGIPDVQQIDSKDLMTRKTLLFLKVACLFSPSVRTDRNSCQTIDPHRFTAAIAGLQSGLLAVVASLKVQFAKVNSYHLSSL